MIRTRIKSRALWERSLGSGSRQRNAESAEVILADKLKMDEVARRDMASNWGHVRCGVKKVESTLRYSLRKRALFLARNHSQKNPAFVLDLGCGEGKTLRELHDSVPAALQSAIIPFGWTLKKNEAALRANNITNVIEGELLSVKPPYRFDLIYSHFGPLFHGRLKMSRLRKTIELLRPGGVAVLHWNNITPTQLRRVMMEEGIRPGNIIDGSVKGYVFVEDEGVLYIQKPVRKLP